MLKISDSMARASFAALRGLAPLPRGHGYASGIPLQCFVEVTT
jgi:hypothetical protein